MTTSFYQDQKQWLTEYSANDLSRTLVREYLYQHNMFKTLNCFENEDKQNAKKIVKSTVIKMLCINNLVVNNKSLQKEKKCKSLLVLLTQYLREKFKERILKQQRSDCNSQGMSVNNREFSMNGDKIIPKENNLTNTIKEKNLVTTSKRQQNINEKTLTQQAFNKKKDTIRQEPIQSKKTSNNISADQKKLAQVHRPSTAKPALTQKKEEKKEEKKVKEIYSKLNVKEQKANEQKDKIVMEVKDFDQINPVIEKQQPNKKQQSLRDSNSAIGRKSNNLISQTSESTQLPTKNSATQISQPQKNYKRYVKQQINPYNNNSKAQIIDTTKETQSYSEKKVEKEKQKIQASQQAVFDEYFDQFEEEPKTEVKEVKHENIFIEKIKDEKKNQKQQEKAQQPIIEQKTNTLIEEQSKASQSKTLQPYVPQQKQPIQTTKLENQPQPCYQPTSNPVSRGGMKLLKRTTKPLSKEQDATQMIGNNIKLLPDDIKPESEDLSIQKFTQGFKKDERKQQLEFKIQTKSDASLLEEIKPIKKQQPKESNVPQTNVKEIKLKKKVKPSEEQPVHSSKFKFDDNFIDQPLNGVKQKYTYEKFSFEKMTIKPELKPKSSNIALQTKINYTQKPIPQGGNPYAQKKKNQKPLLSQKAQEIKKIMFQKGSSYLPKAWHQGFILSPFDDTFYGLKQIEGGPCGIIAAVQCFFLKHLMYLSRPTCQNDLKNQTRRQNCLIAALTDILWKAKGPNNDKITLIIPTNRNFTGSKLQFTSLTEVQIQAQTFESAYESIWNYKSSFIGQANHGVTVIIYSIIMTKGIEKIYEEVDMKENPLIGHHGHCTQELVNLFIAGQASSNCFDGKKQLEDNFTLHGISQKSEFGFLTVFQYLNYIQVGKNLKNPLFPIWVISKQFHYHVVFGNHYLISENNDCSKFDLIYFDGLYACDRFIRLTFDQVQKDQFGMVKDLGDLKNLPLIQQVLLKKWGRRKVDWNGSTKIL